MGILANCLFCRIASKEIPAKVAFEDDQVLAFWDITPQAPTHLLIIPKKHVGSISELESGDQMLMGHLLLTAKKLAEEYELGAGHRLVINTGEDSGQTVQHLHVHLLAGRKLQWPPG